MRLEADRWRLGIRTGEIDCRCRFSGQPLDECRHIYPGVRCALDYGVLRVYELERLLVGGPVA